MYHLLTMCVCVCPRMRACVSVTAGICVCGHESLNKWLRPGGNLRISKLSSHWPHPRMANCRVSRQRTLRDMSTGPLLSADHVSPDQPSAVQLLPKAEKQGAILCLCVSDQERRTSEQTHRPVAPLCRQWGCGVHFGSLNRDWPTASTHWLSKPPLVASEPHNLGYPCHHTWTGTRGSTLFTDLVHNSVEAEGVVSALAGQQVS